jgi:hypothetical protein
MLAAGVQAPETGSYTSAEASGPEEQSVPPTARTLPSGRRVAVWPKRAWLMPPVLVQLRDTAALANANAKRTADTQASRPVSFMVGGLKLFSFPPA